MNKKLQTTLLVILLVLLLILGGMVAGMYWYRSSHVFVEGTAYPKDAEYLDLQGTGISVAHYEELRSLLPDCEIRWEIPFQGQFYADDTRSLAVSDLSGEELALLAYLPQLETIDANGCQDHSSIAMLQEAYPDVQLLYHVTVDGKDYPQDTTEVTLTSLTDEEAVLLGYLPQLKTVHAEGCDDYDQLRQLWQQNPDCTVTYTLSILGEECSESTTTLSYEGLSDVSELMTHLAYLPQLESVHITEPTADAESLRALAEAYPDVTISWDKTVMGVTNSSLSTDIDLSGETIASIEEVEAAMAYFPNAEKVFLGKSGLDNETVAQFREEKRDEYKVVWSVSVCNTWIRTDDTYFMPVKYNIKVKNNLLGNLVYCEDMLCVDLGHKIVTDLSWLSGMPHLKYLIVAHNTLRDLEPIGQLKELIYLEVWDTWATDYTALYGCTALEDLNVSRPYLNVDLKQFGEMPWLKNLWLNQNNPTKEEKAYLAEHLPDTNICYDGYSPTAGGWRELQNYYDMRDLLEMPYNPW